MANRIPEETIEKIRSSVDIVDLVSEYLQLKKQGRSYVGLCPFHDEKTPSFSVSPDKQIYHCFGCGNGGNAYTFLMEIEGFEFLEAVKHLGDKVHVELPEIGAVRSSENNGIRKQLVSAHELLTKYFHSCLLKTNAGEEARSYLEKRGIDEETIRTFQLGFAPNEWDLATNFLNKKGFTADILQKTGMFSKREFDGKTFDRFRNRIMFPIWDIRGNAIAFGGRVLGDDKPKYLNSPETEIFNKGKTLYGFHLAKPTIREKKQVILLEGNVDVVRSHQAGVKNTVASLGTSLTEEQAHLIRRHADTVIICYDSDKAGINAALRSADILEKAGSYVKIASMPDGLDPDDYIGKYGGRRFETDVIGVSDTVTAYKLKNLRREKNLQNEGDRMRYIEEVIRIIAGLKKAVERDHYLRQLANEFSLSLDALKQQQYLTYKQMRQSGEFEGNERKSKAFNHTKVKTSLLPARFKAEQMLLAHMMNSTEIAEQVRNELGGHFSNEEFHALAAYLYGFYEEGNEPDVSAFIHRLPDRKLMQTASEIAMIAVDEEFSEQAIEDYIQQVKNYPVWMEIERLEKEKQAAERGQNPEEAARIAMKILERKREVMKS